MATHDYIISNASGAAVRADLNNALAAIVSNNSNASSPSTTYAYQFWADTTTGQLKLRNSANNAWITIFELDGTMLMEDGTVSAPGLAFAADTNTGLFRTTADHLAIATGGVERIEVGTTEIVFNDSSNDFDFRVESNNNANMLFIDGGNNVVGIGTSSVAGKLHVYKGDGARNDYSTSADGLVIENNSDTGISIDPGAGNSANIFFPNAANHSIGQISHDLSTGELNLRAATFLRFSGSSNTERMRIDSSGRLLLGLTSSIGGGALLQVQGSGNRKAHFHQPDTGSCIIQFTNSVTGTATTDGLIVGLDSTEDGLIFVQEAKTLNFGTNNTERMRIDSSGKIGIGETAPLGKVHIKNADSGGSVGSSADELVIENSDYAGITLLANTQGLINFSDSADVNVGSITYDHSSNFMSFRVNDSERMRITSGGAVTIGRTAGVFDNIGLASFHVYNNEADKYAAVFHNDGNNVNRRGILVAAGSDSGTGISIQFEDGNGSNLGNITFDGATTSYNTTSDYRLKENVVDLDGAITRVKQLAPKRFNFIGVERNVDGFLAHEAQAVVPEAVTGEKDGEEMQGIDQAKLVPLLTAALQEAIAKIETLETKVAALEAG